MARFFAWGAAAFLMLTGAFLLWQGRAQDACAPARAEATCRDAVHRRSADLARGAGIDPQDPRAEALRARRQGR